MAVQGESKVPAQPFISEMKWKMERSESFMPDVQNMAAILKVGSKSHFLPKGKVVM